MEICIVCNGKKLTFNEEWVKKLGLDINNAFEMKSVNDPFYYISFLGDVQEGCNGYVKTAYSTGNYCTDREIMQQRAYFEILNRLLWRFKMVNDSKSLIDTWCGSQVNYVIKYNEGDFKVFATTVYDFKIFGSLLFNDERVAYQAINEIIKPFLKEHPDFDLEVM